MALSWLNLRPSVASVTLRALPAGPYTASVCCGGEGAVNQQLARDEQH